MESSQVYILIAIAALGVIALVFMKINPAKQSGGLSPLASLSFGFVLAGIFFGEERWLGYGLMGMGVILAIADMIRKYRKKKSIE